MGTLTLKEAKELSILKWKDLAESGYKRPSDKIIEKLQHLSGYCGFCEYQINKWEPLVGVCIGCKLSLGGPSCCGGLWSRWYHTENRIIRKWYARKILKLIESIDVENETT